MKRTFAVILAVFFFGIMYGQEKKTGFAQRWDLGISGGAILYSDVAGFRGMMETRAYLFKTAFDLNAFAGAGGLYAGTKNSAHSMTDIYGYALCGADWFPLAKARSIFARLSLRTQLSFGGGYTSDTNGDGNKTGKPGLLFSPAIGADYGAGKLHMSLMLGYGMIMNENLRLTGTTIGLGASYSIFDRSGK